MRLFLVSILLIVLLLSGCVEQPETNTEANDTNAGEENNMGNDVSAELVESGDTVKVEYEGRLESGEVFDSTEKHGGAPLEFVAGAGQMIKGFDEAVVGMRLNQEKEATMGPGSAYGFTDQAKVVEITKEQIGGDWDKLVVGMPISSSVAGNGVIIEKKENSVVVDFNHELAGKTLIFKIKVVEIQKA